MLIVKVDCLYCCSAAEIWTLKKQPNGTSLCSTNFRISNIRKNKVRNVITKRRVIILWHLTGYRMNECTNHLWSQELYGTSFCLKRKTKGTKYSLCSWCPIFNPPINIMLSYSYRYAWVILPDNLVSTIDHRWQVWDVGMCLLL